MFMNEATSAPAAGSSQAEAMTDSASGAPARQEGSQAAGGPSHAQKAPAPKPAAAAKPELFEVKVEGKVIKMTRDELIQHASMGHAAQRRFQEAAQLRKQAENVIGRLRDPKQVMTALQDPALGLTKEQIREEFEEWYAREFIEPEQLTPEQKKIRDYEAKLKKYAEDEKQRETQKTQQAQEAMTSQAREQVQTQIIEALESGKLPKTNFTIRRLAYWMQRNQANGFNAPTEVLIGQVKNEATSSLRELVEASDGEVLIQLLGDNIIQKLRKYDLEQLHKLRQQRGAGGAGGAPTTEQVEQQSARSERAPTSAEVNQRIRQMQKTGRY